MTQFALIGTGCWGKNLLRNFHSLGVLKGICDSHPETLKTHLKSYPQLKSYTSFSDILGDNSISGVIIATPAPEHPKMVQEALLAEKDVFVEKPLAMQADVAMQLAQLAEQKGLVLMTGHLLQHHGAFRALLKLVKKGKLGRLQQLVFHRLSMGPIRYEENALWNFAPHDVSMMLALSGNTLPTRCAVNGGACVTEGIMDTTHVSYDFPEGLQAHVFSSWLHPYKEHRLSIVGTEGMAVFDDTLPWEKKVALYLDCYHQDARGRKQLKPQEPTYLPLESEEPLRNECAHFIRCCKSREKPITDGFEAARVTAVLEMADGLFVNV